MVEKNGDASKESYPRRYLITAAQASYSEKYNSETKEMEEVSNGSVAEPNYQLLEGFENYAKLNNAELIILKMNGKTDLENIFHEDLRDRSELFFGNRTLNSNIKIRDLVVPPQNVDPASGNLRFAQRETALIYAHTKQRLKAVVSGNGKLPRWLITTGALTQPNYNRSSHMGDVAFRDHTYGGIIVEIIDDICYNARHLRALQNGQFVDLGLRYNGSQEPKKSRVEALVLGDIHAGSEDPDAMRASFEMIDFFKPKKLILHDLFDGYSINPFDRQNKMKRAREFEAGRLFLEEELEYSHHLLVEFGKAVGKHAKVYVVASNHPYFLNRYLDSGDFMGDVWNMKIGLELSKGMIERQDPLEAGIRRMGKLPDNIEFLRLDDDLQVRGYQLASHGHKGNSGSRTSNAISRELAHGKSITGHTHTPEALRETYVAGTLSKLDLEYKQGGASSWMAVNVALYDTGTVQMIPIIRGKWKPKN